MIVDNGFANKDYVTIATETGYSIALKKDYLTNAIDEELSRMRDEVRRGIIEGLKKNVTGTMCKFAEQHLTTDSQNLFLDVYNKECKNNTIRDHAVCDSMQRKDAKDI